MFRIEAGTSGRYCDGLNRRSFVQLGMAGMGALGLPQLLQAKEESANQGLSRKDTSVILIWLDGGPGHMDLYDLKPEAPAEYRGIWNPIRTNVEGMEISELFPLQARCADKFSIVRSLHHDNGDHFTAGHFMLTGRGGASGADTPGKAPFVGSVATKMTGPRQPGMPPYVAVPYGMSIGLRPGYFGANYLGVANNPFETDGDPNNASFKVQNIEMPGGMSLDRLENRTALARQFDRLRRDVDARGTLEAMDRFDQQAFELVAGASARKAFDISQEDPRMRDRYGRHSWGQSTLLARRLVEAGTTFVTVHLGGWDHHWDLKSGMERYLPMVDSLVSALFEDLEQRGLSEKVMVMLCGEFSRTPRMNNGGNGGPPLSMGTPGRDHWGNAMFCLMGGGGIRGGQIVGSTNRLGEVPQDRPVTPPDIHHTMFRVLGIDPHVNFLNHSGRPVPALEPGTVLEELL
ncbi:DUF1501 domain-containing protein [Planctellipticum variicoloris]|uniref:DUF1501 domain-containing protein n=1 Tax=Planctellipticum variicoloris TaxID=3064265 RepID=UPI003014160D|nr:DUF1501 domain-containing protein [Planctomycetaceae bacterium SH412]